MNAQAKVSELVCTRCGQRKPADAFPNYTRKANGRSSFCRKCHSNACAAYQRRNRDAVNAARRERYERNRDAINEARRAAYDPDAVRWRNLQRLYGVTEAKYREMLAEQGGLCAICGRHHTNFTRPLSVDHDHSCCAKTPACGECVRGLLCGPCNTALHSVERSAGWLDAASSYVRRF